MNNYAKYILNQYSAGIYLQPIFNLVFAPCQPARNLNTDQYNEERETKLKIGSEL